jgi:hypothetical protein
MVRSVDETTRAQLTTFLARGLERGDSADRSPTTCARTSPSSPTGAPT